MMISKSDVDLAEEVPHAATSIRRLGEIKIWHFKTSNPGNDEKERL